jgi:hypothetical protein
MFGVAVLLLTWLAVVAFAWVRLHDKYDAWFAIGGIAFVGLAVAVLLAYPVSALTGGLLPGYSNGERIGYVTKASTKGVIWKTNEVEVQVGTGEMAALQAPHPLSVPDEAVFAEITSNIGRKARIHYSEWFVQPWRRGDSGYEITRVEWLGEQTTD